ncbi:MAG TPA: hypothetical protein VH476_04430 [Solirubrobacterales bacterium]|jgi:hypothetical protein
MSAFYELVGRLVVKYGLLYVRRRYSRQITIGTGLVAVAVGIGLAYLATKEVPEG